MPVPPINPDSFDKVNYVIDAWTTGCDAPWYIYVETMKPALLTAFITLITFGWDDVLRGFFRPRGLYKRRTGKRKGKWSRRIPRFPELGNTLGKQLPGASEVRGARWNVLGKTLWRIDGAMEMIRFFWLIAAITEDFAFDWTSLLYESYWCRGTPPGKFSYQTVGFAVVGSAFVLPAAFTDKDYEMPQPSWNVWRGATGVNPATITAAVRFIREAPYDPPEVRTIEIATVDRLTTFAKTHATEVNADGTYTMVASGVVPANTLFRVWLTIDVPFARYGDGVVVGVEVLPT